MTCQRVHTAPSSHCHTATVREKIYSRLLCGARQLIRRACSAYACWPQARFLILSETDQATPETAHASDYTEVFTLHELLRQHKLPLRARMVQPLASSNMISEPNAINSSSAFALTLMKVMLGRRVHSIGGYNYAIPFVGETATVLS